MKDQSINTDNLALVTAADLSLVKNNLLNETQLQQILHKTPAEFIRQRPAKGGGVWDYVSGGYIKKALNCMFGWDWDFEIMSEQIIHGEVVVKGRLTCRTEGRAIIKTQYGNKEIAYKVEWATDASGKKTKHQTDVPLSIGNDMKAAATDCLKKCAAEIGIAADIYNKQDFEEVTVVGEAELQTIEEQLSELYDLKKDSLTEAQVENIGRIIKKKETTSYKKVLKFLKTK